MLILDRSSKHNEVIKHVLRKKIRYPKDRLKTLDTYEITLRKKHELCSFNKKYNSFNHLSNSLNDVNDIKPKIKITYFFIFKISYSNCMVHIVDCKGNIIYQINSGLLGFQGKQKSGRYAILAVLNELTKYEKMLKPFEVSVVFLGLVKKHSAFITNKIKKNFKVKIIKCYNMHPHNGCRPKKIRRLKNKKKINL